MPVQVGAVVRSVLVFLSGIGDGHWNYCTCSLSFAMSKPLHVWKEERYEIGNAALGVKHNKSF